MQKEDPHHSKLVKLKYVYPENLQTSFVSSLVVQHQPEFFTLSFFEVFAPPILGETPEEKENLLKSIEELKAKCVSRVILTPEKMKEIVAVMTENLKNYEASKGKNS